MPPPLGFPLFSRTDEGSAETGLDSYVPAKVQAPCAQGAKRRSAYLLVTPSRVRADKTEVFPLATNRDSLTYGVGPDKLTKPRLAVPLYRKNELIGWSLQEIAACNPN